MGHVYKSSTIIRSAVEREEAKVVSIDKRKAHDKYLGRMEEELKEATARMNGLKLKTNISAGIFFFFLYRAIARNWTGIVVARLPFIPIRFVQNISHRGLPGTDVTECSFGLIYTLCTMGLKQNIPRMLGFKPPRSAFTSQRLADRASRDAAKE